MNKLSDACHETDKLEKILFQHVYLSFLSDNEPMNLEMRVRPSGCETRRVQAFGDASRQRELDLAILK